MDAVLRHIKELVELEHGIDFATDKSNVILLNDEDVDEFVAAGNFDDVERAYIGYDVLLGDVNRMALDEAGIERVPIPRYYYPELGE
jgi:adenine-specific DNA-methyltransferase